MSADFTGKVVLVTGGGNGFGGGQLPSAEQRARRAQKIPLGRMVEPEDIAQAYKLRNLIERMFCRLKDWRRIATRYDKLATNFAAAVTLAAIVIWWL
jgi:transposase